MQTETDPPITDQTIDLAEGIRDALCLALVPGIGPRNFRILVDAFGSPSAVLAATPSVLREIPGIGSKLTRAITQATGSVDVASELQRCHDHQIRLMALSDPQYPQRLKEIDDPPPVLYARGELNAQDELGVAIVGTRHATNYGLRQADRLARGLAMAGVTIISGLARGIDAAAHRGALAGGGRTIAVLGSGMLNLYPPEHVDLAVEISRSGAILSESPTLQAPKSGAFPQRNRIISGLSLGVIVVEAGDRSGASITARHAMEQGREVFAVPGQIDNRMSRGCHRLIRDGATLVESVADVIEQLGPMATPMKASEQGEVRHPVEVTLNDQERLVLQAVMTEPTQVDHVVQATGLPTHRVLSTISVLEVKHLIQRTSGTSVRRI